MMIASAPAGISRALTQMQAHSQTMSLSPRVMSFPDPFKYNLPWHVPFPFPLGPYPLFVEQLS